MIEQVDVEARAGTPRHGERDADARRRKEEVAVLCLQLDEMRVVVIKVKPARHIRTGSGLLHLGNEIVREQRHHGAGHWRAAVRELAAVAVEGEGLDEAVAAQRGQTLHYIVLHISNDPTLSDFVDAHDRTHPLPLYSPICPNQRTARSPHRSRRC